MSKKACCCAPGGGQYIAIPCKGFAISGFRNVGELLNAFPQEGTGRPIIYPSFQFDGSRKVVYMMRGGGGGGGGNSSMKGGNAAYVEYEKTASLNYKVRAGAGGTAGNTAQNNTIFAGGGIAYTVAGMGGGGSIIGASQTSADAIVSGGGGAGGSSVASGGHGGTAIGFTGGGLEGGGAATQNLVGSAGGGNATPGNLTRGGRGDFQTASPFPIGSGGGGAGGLKGGGGGGNASGGGGGSSTESTTRSKYSFPGGDSGPGAACNPYIGSEPGLGGYRPLANFNNTVANGRDGIITVYWLDRWCPCQDVNDFPENLFLCLNQAQYDKIIESIDLNEECLANGCPFNVCAITFNIQGEKYILLDGLDCKNICEDVFKTDDPNEMPTDIYRWPFGCSSNPGEIPDNPNSGFIGDMGGKNSPCCRYLSGTRICPVPGSGCGACGCPPPTNIICCETEDKPVTYIGIYRGWYYEINLISPNWFEWGQTLESLGLEIQCVNPTDLTREEVDAICLEQNNICEKTASDDYDKCRIDEPNCINFSASGTGCLPNWCDETICYDLICPKPHEPYAFTFNGTLGFLQFGCFQNENLCAEKLEEICVENQRSYRQSVGWTVLPADPPFEEILSMTITFQCIPEDLNNLPGVDSGTGFIKLCQTSLESGYKVTWDGPVKLTSIASQLSSFGGPFTVNVIEPRVWVQRNESGSSDGLYLKLDGPIIDTNNNTVTYEFYSYKFSYDVTVRVTLYGADFVEEGENRTAYSSTTSPISLWDWEEDKTNINSLFGPFKGICPFDFPPLYTDTTKHCKVINVTCENPSDNTISIEECAIPGPGICGDCGGPDDPQIVTACTTYYNSFNFTVL